MKSSCISAKTGLKLPRTHIVAYDDYRQERHCVRCNRRGEDLLSAGPICDGVHVPSPIYDSNVASLTAMREKMRKPDTKIHHDWVHFSDQACCSVCGCIVDAGDENDPAVPSCPAPPRTVINRLPERSGRMTFGMLVAVVIFWAAVAAAAWVSLT